MSGRLRMICAAAALLIALSCRTPWLVVGLALVPLPWVLRTLTGRRALLRRLRGLLPLMAAVWLASALSTSSFALQRTGLLVARVSTAAVWLTWLTHDLSALQLEHALLALHVPEGFVVLLFTTRRFARQLTATLHAAWAACALRAGLSSLSALTQTIGEVAGVVVLRSLDRSERVAVASALRGGDPREEP